VPQWVTLPVIRGTLEWSGVGSPEVAHRRRIEADRVLGNLWGEWLPDTHRCGSGRCSLDSSDNQKFPAEGSL